MNLRSILFIVLEHDHSAVELLCEVEIEQRMIIFWDEQVMFQPVTGLVRAG